MYFHPLVWSTQCWLFFPSTTSSRSGIRLHRWAQTQTVLFRFCPDIPLSAKFFLSDFLWVKDYTNHVLGTPPSRWYLLVPPLSGQWTENSSLPCHMSEALSYFDKLLHLDPRLAATVSNLYCDDGDSLSRLVFAALIQTFTVANGWVLTQKKDLTVSSRVMTNM